MKKYLIITGILVLLSGASFLGAHSGSVATADDYTAAELNPAALGVGNAEGLAFQGYYNKDGIKEEIYRLFIGSRYSAFVYGKNGSVNDYRISSSIPLFRNFYLGSDIHWINSGIKDANYGVSALARPHNMISVGINVKEINLSDPEYHLGLGLRPLSLFSNIGDRITITGDFSYTEDIIEEKMAWSKPVLGLETELLDGLRLAGNYDFEKESVGVNISMAFKRARGGTKFNYDEDNEFHSGKYYLILSNKDHRSLPNIFRRDDVYSFKLNKEIVDERERRRIGPFVMTKNQVTMERVIERIRILKEDDSIQGIVFINPQFSTNYANILELRKELNDFRSSGKKIFVYADNFGNLQYAFFASVSDAMYLNPNGSVNLVGFSIGVPYFSETLDKLGIDVLDLRSHDYKTGLNIFTETEMTDEERETFSDLLDDYYFYKKEMLTEGRGDKLTGDVDSIINNGPYFLSQNALNKGLVDKLIFEDELEDQMKDFFAKPNLRKTFPNEKMVIDWSESPKAKIALIHATGNIVMSDGQPGRLIGGKTLARRIKEAREDDTVKGIILRVNSGGGSAYASDLIAREIKKCREAGKPVVVSMGGAAASGGYYISAYADKIVAEPTTITGSIGVTGMIPNFTRLFDKIAVNWSAVKRGDNADLLAIYRPIEERDAELMREYISGTYDDFVNVVAEGRGMTYDEVHSIAQGRVWTGKRAKEIGLVDHLGGMDKAIEVMKQIGGFKDVDLEDYSYSYSGFTFNISTSGLLARRAELLSLPEEIQPIMEYKEMYEQWNGERALYLMPFFDLKGIE